MQGWVVVGALSFAVVFGLVVLDFVAYELTWKTRRLHTGQAGLTQLLSELGEVAQQLQVQGDRARVLSSTGGAVGQSGPALHPSES